MGLLDSLKGMVGKGSPKVEVKLFKEQATVQEQKALLHLREANTQ